MREPAFKYPYNPTDGRENLEAGDRVIRVLRGGAWLYDPDDARSAFRYWNYPDYRSEYIGFRCCMASTSSP